MEMPTPCQYCGNIFDLHDGYGSEKWYPNTVICRSCSIDEDHEMEIDKEIQELKENIANAEFDLKEWKGQLKAFEAK